MSDATNSTGAPTNGTCNNETTATNSKKRMRSPNWTLQEVFTLVEAKKQETELCDANVGSRDVMETAKSKCRKISEYLHTRGYERNPDQCQNKWENLISDYKSIKDHDHQTGAAPYFAMSRADRKRGKVQPVEFDQQVWHLIDEIYGKRPAIVPPHTRDSSRDVEATADSSIASPTPGDREPGSSGKKKKRVTTNERLVRVLEGLRDKRQEIDSKMCAIEKEKCDAEREEARAAERDRRALIGALASIAKSWEKISDRL